MCLQRRKEEKVKGKFKKSKLGLRLREGEEPSLALLVLEEEGRRKTRGVLKRLMYGYLSKFGYGFTHLLVRNPHNSLFYCVWISKTIIQAAFLL